VLQLNLLLHAQSADKPSFCAYFPPIIQCCLCSLEYGTYIFFAFWVFCMTVYALGFLPETKGVPIEEMGILWRRHWFWSKIIMTPEERAAFQKGDLLGSGVTTGDHVPANAGALGKGEAHLAGQTQSVPVTKAAHV